MNVFELEAEDFVRSCVFLLLKRPMSERDVKNAASKLGQKASIDQKLNFIKGVLTGSEFQARFDEDWMWVNFLNQVDDEQLPDRNAYRYLFQPWHIEDSLIKKYSIRNSETVVSPDRVSILLDSALHCLNLDSDGEIWECGVYKGGTASFLARMIDDCKGGNHFLRLFDTFGGMPRTHDDYDFHNEGDFADTSLKAVKSKIPKNFSRVEFYPGIVPDTFAGLEGSKLVFAHIDLDIYEPILASCEFVWPRLAKGGLMLFDDYGFPSCPGARRAVDSYFADQGIKPIVLPTGQALTIKA